MTEQPTTGATDPSHEGHGEPAPNEDIEQMPEQVAEPGAVIGVEPQPAEPAEPTGEAAAEHAAEHAPGHAAEHAEFTGPVEFTVPAAQLAIGQSFHAAIPPGPQAEPPALRPGAQPEMQAV